MLRERGIRFPRDLHAYQYATPTGCGVGHLAGPFYCPGDSHIYLDLAFFDELNQRFGAPEVARAYVIAHEYGHHIQTFWAHGPAGRALARRRRWVGRVRTQADCYAGVWAYHANQQFRIHRPAMWKTACRVRSGRRHAEEGQGYIVPDSFTRHQRPAGALVQAWVGTGGVIALLGIL
jgi:predicted metalloprotease